MFFPALRRDDRGSSKRTLHITPLEQRALQLLASGRSTGDVAAGLGISAIETEAMLVHLFAAMGAATRIQAVAAAERRGLLIDHVRR